MARLRNKVTGVVIDVPDEAAEAMTGAWEPAAASKAEPKPKSAPKKSE